MDLILRRTIQGIVIARLSLLLSLWYKNNKTRDITLKAIVLDLCPFLAKIFSKNDGSDRGALVLHVVLWFIYILHTCIYLIIVVNITVVKPWTNIIAILDEKDGGDTELLVYAMTLLNKVTIVYILIPNTILMF